MRTVLTTASIALIAGAFEGLPRASVPDASSVTRIMQQADRSFGTAVLAVILAGRSFQATFWWSVAFTALAVLPRLCCRAAGPIGRRDRKRPAGDLLRPAG
jgi:hypothetical protein